MTEDQAKELIDEQFDNNWQALATAIVGSAVPYSFANEAMPTSDYFATCTAKHTTALQISTGGLGTRREERKGYIFVKLWVPQDKGEQLVSKLAEAARTIFNGKNLPSPNLGDEPITISPGATQEIGNDKGGRWYMEVVAFPFRYYGTF